MDWKQVCIGVFERESQFLNKALDGINIQDLNWQPHQDCNSIGWLVWHLTRIKDVAVNEQIAGMEQLWIKNKWNEKFKRPAALEDRGFGHTSKDVALFKSPDVHILLGYHQAILEETVGSLSKLSTGDLDRKLSNPAFPTVGARLVALINDSLQHTGQVAYLRGLIKGKGWLDV